MPAQPSSTSDARCTRATGTCVVVVCGRVCTLNIAACVHARAVCVNVITMCFDSVCAHRRFEQVYTDADLVTVRRLPAFAALMRQYDSNAPKESSKSFGGGGGRM
jgi:hypothetical protein